MKYLYLFGLFLFLPFFGFSQGEFNNWYFGWIASTTAAVTFNSGSPVAIPNGVVGKNSVNISDSAGNLLFLSNGTFVYNRNLSVMPNGCCLTCSGQSFSQPILAIPKIGDDSSYYIFYTGMTNYINPVPLSYSIVNMRLDGGLGDIEPGYKNVPIPFGLTAWRSVTGTRHKNNKDIWVVTTIDYYDSIKYASYLVSETGISSTPVLSTSFGNGIINGSPPMPPYMKQPESIRISLDGSKMIANYQEKPEFCIFNSVTGEVERLFFINQGFMMQGCIAEFSVDSKYLYLATGLSGNHRRLFQFDASLIDSVLFNQSRILIDSGGTKPPYIQIGPDWKIYGTEWDKDSLCVISNPTNQGSACNFQYNAVGLFGVCGDNLPQFVQRYKAYIHHSGNCQANPVHFSGDIWPPPDSIHWDFGDPASGAGNFSNLPNPTHIYNNPGSYVVELFVRHIDNRTDTSWQTITIVSSPQVALGADRTICTGDSTTFDAGAYSGCTYLWKDLGSGLTVGTSQTFKTGLAGSYAVTVTNSNGCIGTDTVQLMTTSVPSVTNNPLSKSICSGESTNIPLASNVPGTNFHWTASLTLGNITGFSADSGLVINQVLTNALATPGIVTYLITPKVGSCAGTTVDFPVTVNPGDSVKISISASANNICSGTSVTFTASPTNPGVTPVYLWKVNGINSGTNSSTFSYTPLNTDVVTCVLTSSLIVCISNNPATSNGITMVVNPNLPVSITLTYAPPLICAGSPVTFTAHPISGGLTPTYQWYLNSNPAGTNSDTYTFTPVNGDQVSCTLLSSESCTTNNPASSIQYPVSVSSLQPVSVTISASQNPFCTGSSVTFTATPNNGGTLPTYQWKVNGISVGSNNPVYSYSPNNGDIVLCDLTSNIACPISNPATSNSITMVVNTGLPAGINISASANPFCPGSSVTFTATPSNGGPLPTYQWKVNGSNVGINSNTYSYNPVNNDSVRCVMTSNLSCVTGNPASSNKIIMSGTLAPIVTFTSCFDTITTINAKPIKLKGGIPIGGTYTGPGVNSLTGVFNPALAGIGTHTITYTYTNVAMCSALAHAHIINYPLSIVNCGNPITDIRDNKVYPTVQIGSQCWLATNLNYGTILASSQDQRDNCIAEKYCYNDNPTNCLNHGGLYQWDELMLFDETPADQGFCPPGWHIPTENEWNILFANFINSGFAASPLKYSGFSGFNALLSGTRHINKGWSFQGFATFFWSSTPLGSTKAWAHGMNDADPSVSSYPSSRVNAFSVRCLKD